MKGVSELKLYHDYKQQRWCGGKNLMKTDRLNV